MYLCSMNAAKAIKRETYNVSKNMAKIMNKDN